MPLEDAEDKSKALPEDKIHWLASFWKKNYKNKIGNIDFIEGAEAALKSFAVNRFGRLFIGRDTPLEQALEELHEALDPKSENL